MEDFDKEAALVDMVDSVTNVVSHEESGMGTEFGDTKDGNGTEYLSIEDFSLLTCKNCNLVFVDRTERRDHIKWSCPAIFLARDLNDLAKTRESVLDPNLCSNKPYECSICTKSFKLKSQLNVHMLNHDDDRPFPCFFCGKRFKRKVHADTHMLLHDDVDRPYPCTECGLRFKQKGHLKTHMVVVHTRCERALSCKFCGLVFRKNKQLEAHTVSAHKIIARTPTKVCPLGKDPDSGFRSVNSNRVDVLVPEIEISEVLGNVSQSPGEVPFCEDRPVLQCVEFVDVAARDDFTKPSSSNVSFTSKGTSCDDLDEERTFVKLKTETSSGDEDEGPHRCHFCFQEFVELADLDIHTQVAHMKPFSCQFCEKRFDKNNELKKHIEDHTRPWTCSYCGKRFKQLGHLKTHTNLHVDQSRPFSCDFCDQKFKTKGHAKTHMALHTSKDRPYQCDFCVLIFRQKGQLKRHQENAHGASASPYQPKLKKENENDEENEKKKENEGAASARSDEETYQCLLCRKQFAHSVWLQAHLKKHENV